MTPEMVVQILRQALVMAFLVAAPLLAVGFAAGVVISLVQIVTSIQDAAFGAAPRLAAFLGGLLLLMPWMLKQLTAYTAMLFGDFTRYAR
ncbi:MAG: flagellar biosynthetic protein FliQ [Bryobacteraceae bacterium]